MKEDIQGNLCPADVRIRTIVQLIGILSVPERSERTELSKMAIREGILFWGVCPPL